MSQSMLPLFGPASTLSVALYLSRDTTTSLSLSLSSCKHIMCICRRGLRHSPSSSSFVRPSKPRRRHFRTTSHYKRASECSVTSDSNPGRKESKSRPRKFAHALGRRIRGPKAIDQVEVSFRSDDREKEREIEKQGKATNKNRFAWRYNLLGRADADAKPIDFYWASHPSK